jgi:hypothetical protein
MTAPAIHKGSSNECDPGALESISAPWLSGSMKNQRPSARAKLAPVYQPSGTVPYDGQVAMQMRPSIAA